MIPESLQHLEAGKEEKQPEQESEGKKQLVRKEEEQPGSPGLSVTLWTSGGLRKVMKYDPKQV